MQKEDPEGQGDRRQQSGKYNDTGSEHMVISSIFCHNIAGYCGWRTEHDKHSHEFLVAVAKIDGKWKEKS